MVWVRRALLLGAGGAARGVAPALLDAGITEMVIVNRSPERADMLCDALGEPGRVSARYWGDLGDLGNFELIVNATSIGNTSDMRTFSAAFVVGQYDCGGRPELR